MLETIRSNWKQFTTGYKWKALIDTRIRKNLDIYMGDVANTTYLPQYSAKEHNGDYADRLKRASEAFQNYPEKIIDIYRNSIFRSGPPNREGESEAAKRFIKDVDGAGTSIGDFVRERIFILEQVQGGLFVVIDKPQKADNDTLTIQQQRDLNFYPYSYIYTWDYVVNFGVDRYKNLDWILFREEYINDKGNNDVRYRYFDKNDWAVMDDDGKIINAQSGRHGLGMVPVVQIFQRRNPKHNFLTPTTILDNVFRLTLKVFEAQSQFEQMIVNHVFLKLQMPKKMWDAVKGDGLGNSNVFVFDEENPQAVASYVQSQYTEIGVMKDLVFNTLPDRILYFATLRDKVSMPREESGAAKFIDSSDEISNLLDKANSMEKAENMMIEIAKRWENDSKDFKVTYNKVFDIKSTNEQIEEIIKIFKQDMGSPAFNIQIVKRLMRNMLGEMPENTWTEIENDLKYSIDPALDITDVDTLARLGYLNAVRLYKRYNPNDRGMSDEEIMTKIRGNMDTILGSTAQTEPVIQDTNPPAV